MCYNIDAVRKKDQEESRKAPEKIGIPDEHKDF